MVISVNSADSCELPNARAFGANVFRSITSSSDASHCRTQAKLGDLIRTELVSPAIGGDGDEFSQMFWDTAGEELQKRMTLHENRIKYSVQHQQEKATHLFT